MSGMSVDRPEPDLIRLTSDTAGRLDRIAPEVFDEAIKPAQLARFIADPRHVMFLAIVEGTVVGMVSAVEYFHPDKEPQLWINEVGVAPTHQKRGIGRALTARMIEEARSRGCSYAWLGTMQDNVTAQRCFSAVPGGSPAQPFLLYDWELDES